MLTQAYGAQNLYAFQKPRAEGELERGLEATRRGELERTREVHDEVHLEENIPGMPDEK